MFQVTMKKTVVWLLLLGQPATFARSYYRKMDQEDAPPNQVFDGTIVTDENEFPNFVLMCFGGTTECGNCGGTLISPIHVLTAAHCFSDGNGGYTDAPTAVRVGAITNTGGTFVSVASFVWHPDYPPGSDADQVGDIAVLTLAEPVLGVPLMTFNRDTSYPDGINEIPVTGYGYGGEDSAGTGSTVLRKTKAIKVQSDADCTTQHNDDAQSFDSTKQFCTTAETCKGDSGGPLIDSNGVQLGVLSFGGGTPDGGNPCGEDIFDTWTDVAAYADWIDAQTADAPSSAPSAAPIAQPPTAPPPSGCMETLRTWFQGNFFN